MCMCYLTIRPYVVRVTMDMVDLYEKLRYVNNRHTTYKKRREKREERK
jgi:hypothetical protein